MVADGGGAADGAGRAVEGGEEAVAHRLDLATAVDGELAANDGVVALDEVAPGAVGQSCRGLGRADDVSGEDGGEGALGLVRPAGADQELLDLIEQRVLVADPRQVVG